MNKAKGLLDRLNEGPVICAERYSFELERRGYLSAGAYVPEVVLEHPEVVSQLHRDFVHARSDVVEAFTYFSHHEKLRQFGKEEILKKMNREALRIAKEFARETGTLLAGNICNTNAYIEGETTSTKFVCTMFDEQVGQAIGAGVDFIIAETTDFFGEGKNTLEVINK